MATTRFTIGVEGMTCASCEARVERALRAVEGVTRARASASLGEARVDVAGDRVERATLERAIRDAGYAVGAGARRRGALPLLGFAALAAGLLLAIRFAGLPAFLPSVTEGMGYGLIFLVGLATSVHCVAMCGGLAVSQGMHPPAGSRDPAPAPARRIAPTLWYNAGRVASYTAVGAIVGGLGSVLTLSETLEGALPLVAGAFMAFLGVRMLGIFPALSRLKIRLPGSGRLAAAAARRGPLVVGLLSGLMPCGPLQTIQVYALGTGSAAAGALSMFLFSLGTVPLLAGFGLAGSFLGASFGRRLAKASGVLVAVLGIVMVGRGLALFGIAVPRLGPAPVQAAALGGGPVGGSAAVPGSADARVPVPEGAAVARVRGGVQEVTSRAFASAYQPIVVQAGVPVRWTIEVAPGDLNGCNGTIVVPTWKIRKRLAAGKNVVEFTPSRTGTVAWSCWMGMIHSTVSVVPDAGAASSGAAAPPSSAAPGGAFTAAAAGLVPPSSGASGCACCASP